MSDNDECIVQQCMDALQRMHDEDRMAWLRHVRRSFYEICELQRGTHQQLQHDGRWTCGQWALAYFLQHQQQQRVKRHDRHLRSTSGVAAQRLCSLPW